MDLTDRPALSNRIDIASLSREARGRMDLTLVKATLPSSLPRHSSSYAVPPFAHPSIQQLLRSSSRRNRGKLARSPGLWARIRILRVRKKAIKRPRDGRTLSDTSPPSDSLPSCRLTGEAGSLRGCVLNEIGQAPPVDQQRRLRLPAQKTFPQLTPKQECSWPLRHRYIIFSHCGRLWHLKSKDRQL